VDGTLPLLDIVRALPEPSSSRLPPVPLDLRVMAEESILIEAHDPSQAAEFADLCCGLLPLQSGSVRFLGNDWASTPHERASALRGRIGQVGAASSWIRFLPADANILLQPLHHTRLSLELLRDRAAELSRGFGLPGLPMARPDELRFDDRVRAACVRAFVGEPQLVILKSQELEQVAGLKPALLNALAAARNRQAATIWLMPGHAVWNDRSVPVTRRLRLTDHGLVASRMPP
jgi:phospholipid/cholesterol/gamma-HCH transport system ATP-binding protein